MEDNTNISFESRIDLSELHQAIERLKKELSKVIVGQEKMIELMIASLLANGHVLIEGVPGIAKTMTARLLAKTIKSGFSRIQFTPDLMPSDILGTSMINAQRTAFEFKKGPIFSNIILIDEINRAPAKTQSALFEVMEERQVTIDGNSYPMKSPFLVFATQNPIEQEGTYRLPEAQLDRFLFKIEATYPSLEEETQLLTDFQNKKNRVPLSEVESVLSMEEIIRFQQQVQEVHVEEKLIRYIAQIVNGTRNNPYFFLGASPRASLAIMGGAKAFAAMGGRDFITPEDIQKISVPVLKHRVILTPEKEMEGVTADESIRQILETIEVPR
ncbi:AAA family ATPase [Xanthovirga aplysinae]|uniref:AAA family ATPase n=1 Tax=Xanthovirga aplysinae TaxID=2529853 RepID=UPI0012BCBE43|nr:MoxR family ATPase [Xanthovirga aplysinae]MTI32844.1 MoxR family ATPase [Xanthovirga aplysinae]